MACSLRGTQHTVRILPGTLAHHAYGRDQSTEQFLCSFGLNDKYRDRLFADDLMVAGEDGEGNVRLVELPRRSHPFFVATLFVPQLSSGPGAPHPLIMAFLEAAVAFRSSRGDAAPASSVYDERYAGDYREHLSGYEIARWKALHHFVRRVIKPAPPATVLDYGAGSGLHVGLWESLFPEAELSFCDISPVAMEKFNEKYPRQGGRYFLAKEDVADLPDASFDVVASVEVMEHVEDLDAYLRDIFRLVKPGGWFIWTTPCGNRLSIEHVFSLLTGKIARTPEGYLLWKWEDPTHARRLRSKEIEGRLKEMGFADVRFRFRSHFFSFVCTYVPTRLFQGTRNRLMTLDYSLFRRLPNGASMVGAAQKPTREEKP